MIKSKIAGAIVAALSFTYSAAYAQSAPTGGSADQSTTTTTTTTTTDALKAKRLKEVTVTGSLIPSSEVETA